MRSRLWEKLIFCPPVGYLLMLQTHGSAPSLSEQELKGENWAERAWGCGVVSCGTVIYNKKCILIFVLIPTTELLKSLGTS